jgi:hypothetical protein
MRGFGILALSLMLASGTAHAGLNFDFSFTGTAGIAGTVTGEIFGLTDNSTSAPTDVVIDSYPAGITLPGTPWDIFNAAGFILGVDRFTVSGGQITAANLQLENPGLNEDLVLNSCGFNQLQGTNLLSVVNSNGFSGITFTSSTSAPEPASIALLLSGLFGLRMIRRRRG